MIEAGQTWEFTDALGSTELFAVLEVVIKGKTDASAETGYCKLLKLDGENAGLIMWEWSDRLMKQQSVMVKRGQWRRFA